MSTDVADPIAEQRASGSTFYTAMRLLPKPAREAMYAIYAFCRAVDDIADDAVRSRGLRHAELEDWRTDIEALYAGFGSPRTALLAKALDNYSLRKQDFLSVIDGMTMDVAQDIRAPSLSELDLYCDLVASAVGRLSIKVFGMDEEPGFRLAHHLGRALQLTNILRDLDEDAGLGRLYLPREFLDGASVAIDTPASALKSPQLDPVCRGVAGIARQHYREADASLVRRPRGDLRAPRLMSAVYASLLSRMETQGWIAPRRRARVARTKLLWFVLRYGIVR